MQTHARNSAAEKILRRRWQEMVELQQRAEADECQMAEAVLMPQPGALKLAGGMSLAELSDFVPSATGLAGQFEQALHQFAVMSFRWAVHNLMISAQVADAGLRDTHRQLAHWYGERATNLMRELRRFRQTSRECEVTADGTTSPTGDPVALVSVAADVSAFGVQSVIAAPAIPCRSAVVAHASPPFLGADFNCGEPLREPFDRGGAGILAETETDDGAS